VVDDHTIRFNFAPHADYLETWRGQPIFPQHLLGEVPVDSLHAHPYTSECPVGNGPFRFLSHSADESWTFEANPAFPSALGGRPPLDRYVYRSISEHATLQIELVRERGGLDVFVQMLPLQAAAAKENPNLSVLSFPYPSIFFVAWNSRIPQLSDARVRRALTLGIDRQRIVDGYHAGEATILNASLPPVHWAYTPALEDSLVYDPAAARELLDAAGWLDTDGDGVRENADGVRLELELVFNQNQERIEVAETIRLQLQEIGVEVRPRVMELASYEDLITGAEKAFDAALITFETGFRIDDRDLFHSQVVDGPWAFSGTMDLELDRFLDTLQLIPDRKEAAEVWKAYHYRLLQVQPYTFLYSSFRRDGLKKRIQGAVMDKRGDWASIRHWWIDPQDRRTP
jgi:peptide/nickel transport system substrate-binding protein